MTQETKNQNALTEPQDLIAADAVGWVTDLRERFAAADLHPSDSVRGWVEGQRGSIGWAIGPTLEAWAEQPGHYHLHLVLDGKKVGLDYREWTHYDEHSGDMQMHEPTNPKSIVKDIERVLRRAGLQVVEVRYSGCQQHWDHDVDYSVTLR